MGRGQKCCRTIISENNFILHLWMCYCSVYYTLKVVTFLVSCWEGAFKATFVEKYCAEDRSWESTLKVSTAATQWENILQTSWQWGERELEVGAGSNHYPVFTPLFSLSHHHRTHEYSFDDEDITIEKDWYLFSWLTVPLLLLLAIPYDSHD